MDAVTLTRGISLPRPARQRFSRAGRYRRYCARRRQDQDRQERTVLPPDHLRRPAARPVIASTICLRAAFASGATGISGRPAGPPTVPAHAAPSAHHAGMPRGGEHACLRPATSPSARMLDHLPDLQSRRPPARAPGAYGNAVRCSRPACKVFHHCDRKISAAMRVKQDPPIVFPCAELRAYIQGLGTASDPHTLRPYPPFCRSTMFLQSIRKFTSAISLWHLRPAGLLAPAWMSPGWRLSEEPK